MTSASLFKYLLATFIASLKTGEMSQQNIVKLFLAFLSKKQIE